MPVISAIFPGQGSQRPGMACDLFRQFPEITAETFQEAEDHSKLFLKKLCTLPELESKLKETSNQQPAILATSIAMWKILTQNTGIDAATILYAGHSLGEYSALVAANKIEFSQAIATVKSRGEAMQRAVPLGVGAMAAVLKCEPQKLKKLCLEVSQKLNLRAEIANYNNSKQIIISGHSEAVKEVCTQLRKEKILSKLLPVSAPFHSSLMKKAKEEMTPVIKQIKITDNSTTVIANINAKATSSYTYEHLIKQIDSPVLWEESIKTALNLGSKIFIEVGPGQVLSRLSKVIAPQAQFIDSTNMPATISYLNKEI
jgi:[acyl-carrier-protein] S-malonyltransferase